MGRSTQNDSEEKSTALTTVRLNKGVQVGDTFLPIGEHAVDKETLEKIKVFKSVEVL